MRWPRKNDPASIRSPRGMSLDGGLVTSIDLEPFAGAAEALTGVAVIPVSACPVAIELGAYELSDDGDVVETGRDEETVHVPLAHTEGSLTLSMTRGSTAAGTVRTHVLADRITRASCFVCADAGGGDRARALDRGRAPRDAGVARLGRRPVALAPRALREVKTHVVGPMCHVLWAWTTGDAVGPNMMTRNAYALNMGYVMQRAPVKPERAYPRGEHGRRQEAVVRVLPVGPRQDRDRRGVHPRRADRARPAHDRRRPRGALVGRHARRGRLRACSRSPSRPRSAIAAIFAATGQDLGMVGTSSMAHGTARRVEGGLHASIRFPGLEVGTIGGGTTLPSARDWLASIGCAGAGKVYRFAQIVAAAALCLEISASASMATAGSENFFKAHHERGGLR